MKQMTETQSGDSLGNSDHCKPDEYQRTGARCKAFGYCVPPTEIEGSPAFLVSHGGTARMFHDLAEVETFLDRAGACTLHMNEWRPS